MPASGKAEYDYSALKPGTSLRAEHDGVYYAAEVVEVTKSKKYAKAPVKVHFYGYGEESDVWVSGDRIRSKLLVKKDESGRPSSKEAKERGSKAERGEKKDAGKDRASSRRNQRERVFSLADQVARFARAKEEKNERYLNISSVYNGSVFKGKRVLVVGGNRGIGFELSKALLDAEASLIVTTRTAGPELDTLKDRSQIISSVEVTDLASMNKMAEQIKEPLDYVIFNAGYFPEITDNLDSIQEAEAIKQFDICAMGPVRCVAALKKAGLLKGAKVAIITSQAGSAKWRFTQNKDKGGDYGHHMCRAACNIAGVLMSEELKSAEVPIVLFHPGFNRTSMTKKYSHIWDIEGAVEASEGAMRVLYEVGKITMKSSGKYINCEDGLQIPF